MFLINCISFPWSSGSLARSVVIDLFPWNYRRVFSLEEIWCCECNVYICICIYVPLNFDQMHSEKTLWYRSEPFELWPRISTESKNDIKPPRRRSTKDGEEDRRGMWIRMFIEGEEDVVSIWFGFKLQPGKCDNPSSVVGENYMIKNIWAKDIRNGVGETQR